MGRFVTTAMVGGVVALTMGFFVNGALAEHAAALPEWTKKVEGTYKGTVGANGDPIVFKFAMAATGLSATYEIDDPEFKDKPYTGKLMKFEPVEGKAHTLKCRYDDEMNAGSYELTFTEDLSSFKGTYVIDDEVEDPDNNTVSAKKQ